MKCPTNDKPKILKSHLSPLIMKLVGTTLSKERSLLMGWVCESLIVRTSPGPGFSALHLCWWSLIVGYQNYIFRKLTLKKFLQHGRTAVTKKES